MRFEIALVVVLLVSVFLICCAEEADPPGWNGSACGLSAAIFCDGDRLAVCGVDGRVAYQPCKQLCAEAQLEYRGVCEMNEDLGHDFCVCEQACCTEGEQQCVGGNLQVCSNCEMVTISCFDYCTRMGGLPVGCGIDPKGDSEKETCLCDIEDGEKPPQDKELICGKDFVKCRDSYVNACGEDSGWDTYSCRDECKRIDRYMDYCQIDMETGEEECVCTPVSESIFCRQVEPTCQGDLLAVCVGGSVELVDCRAKCDELDLRYSGCKRDADRKHDVCYCGTGEIEVEGEKD